MAATLTSTGITFSDGTSLNTAFPSANGVGAFRRGLYIVTGPYASGDGTTNYSDYGAGTTISGGSLAIEPRNYNTGTGSVYGNGYMPDAVYRREQSGRVSMGWQGSGSSQASNNGMFSYSNSYGGGNYSYSTASGSWRSMEAFSVTSVYNSYFNRTQAAWNSAIWQRYA